MPIAFGGNNTSGPIDVATALNACTSASGRMDFETETFVTHSLRGEGFDASEDGTGRGTPLVPVAFDCKASGDIAAGAVAPTLRAKYLATPKPMLPSDPAAAIRISIHLRRGDVGASGTFAEWFTADEVKVLATAGVVRGRRLGGGFVRVCIPLPEQMRRGLEIDAGGRRWSCDFCVTGVPHVVTYVEAIADLDIAHAGPALRYHGDFQPRGANANFVQVIGEGEIAVRTWEFGVEGETLSCGTGSSASAILGALRFGWPEKYLRGDAPVLVHARSGDTLRVYFAIADGLNVTDLCIETLVRFVCTGRIHADLAAKATGE